MDATDVAWMVGDEGGETLKKTMPMIKTMITTKMYDGKCDDNDDVYAMMTTTRMVCFFDLTSHGDRITIRGAPHYRRTHTFPQFYSLPSCASA